MKFYLQLRSAGQLCSHQLYCELKKDADQLSFIVLFVTPFIKVCQEVSHLDYRTIKGSELNLSPLCAQSPF